MGVELAAAKTEGPTNKLTFLGVELYSMQQCSRLLADKLATLKQFLLQAKQIYPREFTLQKLQVLVGHLNFVCRVVAPGRAFLRHLCNTIIELLSPWHRVQVTGDKKGDMGVWLSFLKGFNGISFRREV